MTSAHIAYAPSVSPPTVLGAHWTAGPSLNAGPAVFFRAHGRGTQAHGNQIQLARRVMSPLSPVCMVRGAR